ncbi:MAG: hypothetical protein ACI9R3_005150, partial [Verrucomicrobiales bacterium]
MVVASEVEFCYAFPVLRFLRCLFVIAFFHCCIDRILLSAASAQGMLSHLQVKNLEPSLAGQILLEELNCVACHSAGDAPVPSRAAPLLSSVGSRVN